MGRNELTSNTANVTHFRSLLLAMSGVVSASPNALAQGAGTAVLHGRITSESRSRIDARVRVRHEETGFTVEVRVSGGRFLVAGLEAGGPYLVDVTAIGLSPEQRRITKLGIGEVRREHFVLHPAPQTLAAVSVETRLSDRRLADGGAGMIVDSAILKHLPTLNRDQYDFARLAPHVSLKTSVPNQGLTAGVGFRFNNYFINGVSERTPGGVSIAFAGLRSVPLDAVREYQVLLTPFDVQYGDFGGAMVNAVTRSGTNDLTGSVFIHGRTDQLARRLDGSASEAAKRAQYGLTLGGPILTGRAHFFVAAERQHVATPAPGLQADLPVAVADLARYQQLLEGHGLSAGSAGPVTLRAPVTSLFTRFDVALPRWNSRLAAWNNTSTAQSDAFSRAVAAEFPLSSLAWTSANAGSSTALHLHTALDRRGERHNELHLSFRSGSAGARSEFQQPIVRVTVPSVSGGSIALSSGTNELAQGTTFRTRTVTLRDNVTFAYATNHVATTGLSLERFEVQRGSTSTSFGTWDFATLDDLAAGRATRYEVRLNPAHGDPPLRGLQLGAWIGDHWQPGTRLTVTGGLRADLLSLDDRAPRVLAIEEQFGRRTDQAPGRRLEYAPRLGFVWESGDALVVLRGGAGVYSTRYPLAWAHWSLANYGLGTGILRCNYLGGPDRYPPAFQPDYRSTPTACGGGAVLTQPSRDVDLLDPHLRMMRVARSSLAHERRIGRSFRMTHEILLTRALSDFQIVNLGLPQPIATDPHGRVMYAALSTGGTPARPPDSAYTVMELQNTGRNRSVSITARLETVGHSPLTGLVSYTWSRTRDVQSLTRVNTRGLVAWATAAPTGGRHSVPALGVSANDLPHRVVAAGTWHGNFQRRPLEVSFYYVGESGRPFTYLAFGTLARGDLNGDGSNSNDPVFVPNRSSTLTFSGISDSTGADTSAAARSQRIARQRDAFEQFVNSTDCLRRQRGRIALRNSCREPWNNLTIASVRYTFTFGARHVDAQLDMFNVLNLLNSQWGLRREAVPAVLEHVAQTGGDASRSEPIFRFDASAPRWTLRSAESAGQLQLSMRYRF